MVNEADIPNSEMVPQSHRSCTPILRLAQYFHLTQPRIAYLCVHGALEESRRIDPRFVICGTRLFRLPLKFWIKKNDETSEQGQFQPNTDLPHLQSFCLDYYEKHIIVVIKMIGNQYLKAIDSVPALEDASDHPNDDQASTSVRVTFASSRAISDQLIYACETALVLFKVLELLSKDVQLPYEILEAHTEVKVLAEIFRPYNVLPRFYYRENHLDAKKKRSENHPIQRLPELQAALKSINSSLWGCSSRPTQLRLRPTHKKKRDEYNNSGMLKRVNNSSQACQVSKLVLFIISSDCFAFAVLLLLVIIITQLGAWFNLCTPMG